MEVNNDLVHSDLLATALLRTTGRGKNDTGTVSLLALVTEVISELVHSNDETASTVLCTAVGDDEADFTAMISASDTLLAAVTEVSPELVHGDDDLSTAVLSTTGIDNEEVTTDFTVMIPDSVTLLGVVDELSTRLVDDDNDLAIFGTTAAVVNFTVFASVTPLVVEVNTRLLQGNDDSATAILNTTEADAEVNDKLTGLMTDSVILLAVAAECSSTELVDGDADLAAAALSTAGQHTELSDRLTALTSNSVALPAVVTEVTDELVHGNEDSASSVLRSAAKDSGVRMRGLSDNTVAEMLLSVSLSTYGTSLSDA